MSRIVLGSGDFRFRLVEDWPRIPEGIDQRAIGGMAVDSHDNVHLATRTLPQHQVMVYSPQGEFIRSWGAGILKHAHGLRIVNDIAYLTDLVRHQVLVCTLEGEVLLTLGSGLPSDTGYVEEAEDNLKTIRAGVGPFNMPTQAMPTSTGEIMVSDGYGNARVHRFSPSGELISSWGEPGAAPGQFNLVHSLWVDDEDRVYVSDRENNRVQIFEVDGTLLEIWPDIPRPADVCLDGQGHAFVGELFLRKGRLRVSGDVDAVSRPSKVSVRDLHGDELASFGGEDRLMPGNFASAHSLCLDSKGDLYVGEVTAATLSARNNGGVDDYRPGMKTAQKFERVV